MSSVYPFIYRNYRDVIYADYMPIIPNTRLPLTLTEVKQHLAIPICDSTNDIQLQTMIQAVILQAEDITGRTFLTTTFLTFRDYFPHTFMLKKSPVQNLVSFEYFVNGVLVPVDPTLFELTQSRYYPLLSLLPGKLWPTNFDIKRQTIHITFKAGYGDTELSIPADLRIAMLNHIAFWWANRGDCNCDSAKSSLPEASKMIYGEYMIKSFTGLPPQDCGFGWY